MGRVLKYPPFFSIIINRVDCCKYVIAVGHTRVWQITANMRKRGEKMTEKEKIRIQTSETFLLSAILALSGGFQDAYTYNVRNEVFSNAQTGNVVLMSQHLMMGEWMKGLSYLFPILSFALGVLVAERIGHRYKKAKRIHWRQIVVMIEIIILFVVGFIPHRYDMIATMLVSFSCSMQVQSFRKVNGYGYASTMCIGNLRSGTESLSIYLRDRNIGALKKTAHYYGIILIFAIGAGIGGVWLYTEIYHHQGQAETRQRAEGRSQKVRRRAAGNRPGPRGRGHQLASGQHSGAGPPRAQPCHL